MPTFEEQLKYEQQNQHRADTWYHHEKNLTADRSASCTDYDLKMVETGESVEEKMIRQYYPFFSAELIQNLHVNDRFRFKEEQASAKHYPTVRDFYSSFSDSTPAWWYHKFDILCIWYQMHKSKAYLWIAGWKRLREYVDKHPFEWDSVRIADEAEGEGYGMTINYLVSWKILEAQKLAKQYKL